MEIDQCNQELFMKYCWKFLLFCLYFAAYFHLFLENISAAKFPYQHAAPHIHICIGYVVIGFICSSLVELHWNPDAKLECEARAYQHLHKVAAVLFIYQYKLNKAF